MLWARRHNHMFHDMVIAACTDAGFRPQIAQEAGELGTILGLVAGGLGVSLVPASTQRARAEGIVCLPLQGQTVEIALALAWKDDRRMPIVDTLITTAKELWPVKGRRSSQ